MGAHKGRPYGFGWRRGFGVSGRRWSGFVVVVELYLSDEFFGCGHAQVGLVLGMVALHYADEADDDVSAVVGLFLTRRYNSAVDAAMSLFGPSSSSGWTLLKGAWT